MRKCSRTTTRDDQPESCRTEPAGEKRNACQRVNGWKRPADQVEQDIAPSSPSFVSASRRAFVAVTDVEFGT